MKAHFKGFYSRGALNSQMIGTLTDETDPENVMSCNMTYQLEVGSTLSFTFEEGPKEAPSLRRMMSSLNQNHIELPVTIFNGKIISR